MNSFSIAIPNDRAATYRIVTFIVLSLNFFGFGYIFLQSQHTFSSAIAVVAIVFNAAPWIYYLINNKHLQSPAIEITGIASAFIWMYFGNYFLGMLLLLFTAFGYFANKKKAISFSEEGISYPSFPEKKYSWEDVSHVILKDDILTIDLKNNKLIQINVIESPLGLIDTQDFNAFCARMLESHSAISS